MDFFLFRFSLIFLLADVDVRRVDVLNLPHQTFFLNFPSGNRPQDDIL